MAVSQLFYIPTCRHQGFTQIISLYVQVSVRAQGHVAEMDGFANIVG